MRIRIDLNKLNDRTVRAWCERGRRLAKAGNRDLARTTIASACQLWLYFKYKIMVPRQQIIEGLDRLHSSRTSRE